MAIRISFTIPADEKRALESYARVRGHSSAAALARAALYEYIRRHPTRYNEGQLQSELKRFIG